MTEQSMHVNQLQSAIAALLAMRPQLARWMGYYRNPRRTCDGSAVQRQYQEIGLPPRITGFRQRGDVPAGPLEPQRKEVVIENDIAWRLNTMVDFAVGAMPLVASTARDAATRTRLTAALQRVLAASGGVGLLQELVLLGSIHGSAYVMLRPEAALLARIPGEAGGQTGDIGGGDGGESAREVPDNAGLIETAGLRLLVLEASRVLPVFADDAASGAALAACALVGEDVAPPAAPAAGFLTRMGRWVRGSMLPAPQRPPLLVDVYDAHGWQRWADEQVLARGGNPLGFVPVVGYINQPDPARPAVPGLGLSDVEALAGLQDELNTRLSDRAGRVTMQSCKMYLGKGIESFIQRPIAPGQMWATDNLDASIESFGGDAATPSEDAHIAEIREALDKISGVPPVAAGLLRGKVGNLTSAVALRVTLIALLARTARKRTSLGLTLATLCRRILETLAAAGVEPSAPEDRDIEITWPSALPENMIERLTEAQMKVALGVARAVVLGELGY